MLELAVIIQVVCVLTLKIFMHKLKHVHARALKLNPSIETQPNDAVLMLLAFYCKLVHYIYLMAGKLRSLAALDKEL